MIQREDRDGIRILRLAHDKVSAMDIELGEAFMREMDDAVTAPVKAVIVTGTGSSFSAGGCIRAACCDHRIMVEGNGRIGIPELAVGVPFPALPLQVMRARLTDAALRDLVFTGRTVHVDEAKTLGLIDEKCPSGMLIDRGLETAQRLASIPAGGFALTKEAFYTPILDRAKALTDYNARVVDAWMQPHTYDTIRAYLDRTIAKRNP
jgi:enoyl-CoA hydratase